MRNAGLTALPMLALAACNATSMGGLHKRAPVLEADSSKTTEAISSCLAAASEKMGGSASFVPTSHGGTITAQLPAGGFGGSVPLLYASIEDQGQQRHVSIRMLKMVWKGQNQHRMQWISACL